MTDKYYTNTATNGCTNDTDLTAKLQAAISRGASVSEIIDMVREHGKYFEFDAETYNQALRDDERAKTKAECREAIVNRIYEMPEKDQRHRSIIDPILKALDGVSND